MTESRLPELQLPQRSLPAFLMSLGFHILILVVIGLLIAKAATQSGTGDDPDRVIGIALSHSLPDRTRYEEVATKPKNQTVTESEANARQTATAAAPPADLTPPIDLENVLAAMTAEAGDVSGTGIAGDQKMGATELGAIGSARTTETGEKTTTTVFGVSGRGSTFVYVFDRSDSMNGFGGRPLAVAKRELIKSLQTLTAKQQFQIIFYNDHPKPYRIPGQPTDLFVADESVLQGAENYVRSVGAFGGTEHETALLMALRMAPDVIFFLTDARIPRLTQSELVNIRRRAKDSETSIHAIEFGPELGAPASSFLRELSSQNNGQYQYVSVSRLRGDNE